MRPDALSYKENLSKEKSTMQKRMIVLLLVAVVASAAVFAQATSAGAVNGMTFNGSTGLIVVPDARVGWENSKVGVDVGYGFIFTGDEEIDHIPRFAVTLFKKFEVSGAMQMGKYGGETEMVNFILGGKFQLYKKSGAALALGGDIEFANEDVVGPDSNSAKLFLAATYGGNFFNMPAVTTATFGWQLFETGELSSQFLYGMGFSMGLFPSVFKDYVFWITDFSNFSYVVSGSRINALERGSFNTGIRIHPVKSGRFNLLIDVVGTDLLDDENRGIGATVSGGYSFL